ncbi:MATE family efflux transporter [Alkaliphilus serpentinus]|uniref:Probable multidrug resistance protein NorM n=1 Tax=Alkaliphilus serpentinus TaxID=1482731 RepID=A0A833M9P4_9FIRM|nr:MATE family efflux transporter [Alkaliphilus serpentinus]KAB3529059.1 MATE family efflux transporter [Alkaliphilus serpentinus]
MNLEISEPSQKEIRKKILSMILPITIENILQMTAGFVAMAMIGRISAASIGAVGLSQRIVGIIWALFKGVTTGATVFVAQAYGANDTIRLKKVVQQTLLSSILLVLALQQIIYWFAPDILKIFGAKGNILIDGTLYLRTVSWGLPFMAIILVVTGISQGMGNAKTPAKIALIMNLINISLGYILIFGPLGLPSIGLKGAGIAMVSSQFVAALLGLYVLFNRNGVLGSLFNLDFFKLDIKQVLEVYRVGSPSAAESIFWQLSSLLITMMILSFGELALASYQLGLQTESISYMPAMGFGIAATAFIGQTIGANNPQLGRKYIKEIVKGSLLVTALASAILLFMPAIVLRLLTDQQEVIDLGVKYLILMGLVQIPQSMSGVLNGALRGAGYTKVPMIVAGTGLWAIRIPVSYILYRYFNTSVTAIWMVMSIDLIFRFLLSFYLYKKYDVYNNSRVVLKEIEI